MSQYIDRFVPFRWNIHKREQLGGLLEGELAEVPDGYLEELSVACAKVVAHAGNGQLVFLGRSPEHFFDYLSGTMSALDGSQQPILLQFSKAISRAESDDSVHQFTEPERASFQRYLEALAIDPATLQHGAQTVRFVDLVSTGQTFLVLLELLQAITDRQGAAWSRVKDSLGFVGLTARGKNSPNAYRWQQHDAWRASTKGVFVKNVSIPHWFYRHIGDQSDKVTTSYTRELWTRPNLLGGPPNQSMLKALRRSVHIYDLAASKEERTVFARHLAEQHAYREPWLRSLVKDIKTGSLTT